MGLQARDGEGSDLCEETQEVGDGYSVRPLEAGARFLRG